MRIIQVLDLSTAHIPERLGQELATTDGLIVHEVNEGGYLMWIPDDPWTYAIDHGSRIPLEMLQVQIFARVHKCDFVLFDRDAELIDELPSWEW